MDPAGRPGTDRVAYDAFISYSHRDNRGVAIAVQRGLERFAKPWYRLRAMRVFRDDASLSANPDLWASIEAALSRSSWLIVVGSPLAARSPWVHREIRWWLDHRDVSTILLVVASSEVDTPAPVDGPPAAAVPAVLTDAFVTEPRWVDLREVDVGPKASPEQRERLRRAVADIVATMRDRPKEDLYGDALREHRRTIRLAAGAVAGLVVLTVAALIATLLAVDQRDEARTQAAVATSRQLAATAQSLIATDLNSSLLVAAEAYSMDRSPVTRSALLRAVTSAPNLHRYLPAGHRVSALAAAADGGAVSVGTEDGFVVGWDTGRYERRERRIGDGPVTLLDLSADGGTMLAGTAERAYLWPAGPAAEPVELDGRAPVSVTISPTGRTLAVLWRDGTGGGATLRVYDGTGRPTSDAQAVDGWDEVALDDDGSVLLINTIGVWERRNARTLVVEQPAADVQLAPAGGYLPGGSADGGYYAFAKNGFVSLSRTRSAPGAAVGQLPEGRTADGFPTGEAAELAVTRAGSMVAVANAGTLYVADTYSDEQAREGYAHSHVTPIVGIGPLVERGLAFAGDRLLVGAGPDGVTIWDLELRDGMVRRQAWVADGPTAGPEPQISLSGDGGRILVEGGGDTFTQGVEGGPVSVVRGFFGRAVPVLGPDGATLYLAGTSGSDPADFGSDDPHLTVVPLPIGDDDRTSVLTAAVAADGSRVVVVDSTSAVHVFRTSDHTIERSWPGGIPQHPDLGPWPQATGWASISPGLTRVAVATDQGAQLTDVQTGARSMLPGGPVTEVVFRGDQLLVRRPNRVLELWDPSGTTVAHTLADHGYERAIDVVEGTTTLVRLRQDGTVVLTDYRTGDDLGSFALPEPASASAVSVWAATSLAVDQRHHSLLTASSGGELRRWDLDERDWLGSACRMAGRDLTPDEWRRYVGTTPPDDLRCGRSRS